MFLKCVSVIAVLVSVIQEALVSRFVPSTEPEYGLS